ncbi:hypothetical protein [Blastopirellula retiformator]|uniref:Uncharacterized protein n=1 Tax=Blastopirellula retiformator TaxID=2527970 RepID=A0A5C5VJ50_9BACT|nr:hypothetical protein [Blastopirellula retiformator]TWT38598.1 hypothetical protein Enr8_02910 [Blastopirellula retiformator]
MSMSVYPAFNPELTGVQFEAEGKLLFDEFEMLDAIAETIESPWFSSFGDDRPIPEDFDGDEDDLEEALGPWDEWYSAQDGLAMVVGLIDAIAEEPDFADQLNEPQEVIAELEAMKVCLEAAIEQGAKFRLELAP